MRACRYHRDDLVSGSRQDTKPGESPRPQGCRNGLYVVKSGAFLRKLVSQFLGDFSLSARTVGLVAWRRATVRAVSGMPGPRFERFVTDDNGSCQGGLNPTESSPAGDALYGSTRKGTLLDNVPLGVTTSTVPVVAPAGTVVVSSVLDNTSITAGVPLKATLVAPSRLFPRILTTAPTLPEVGCVSTDGLRPRDSLKTVPLALAPPATVVP